MAYPTPERWGRTTDRETGRERRRIQGAKPISTQPTGLDGWYILQNRAVPAFPGGRSKMPSVEEQAAWAHDQGMQVGRNGLQPYGLRQQPQAQPAAPLPGYLDPNNNPFAVTSAPPAPAPMQSQGPIRGDMMRNFGLEPNVGTISGMPKVPTSAFPFGTGPAATASTPAAMPSGADLIAQRRTALQSRADEIGMQRQLDNPSPVQVGADGNGYLRSKYGTGRTGGPAGMMVGNQTGKDFFQDAANRQGEANKYAKPQNTAEDMELWRKAFSRTGPARV